MHPVNLGRIALSMPGPVPCTPAGIEALLAHYEIPVAGRNVCILGRGVTHRPPARDAALAEAPDRERRGHRRAHRRARLGRVRAAGRRRGRGRGRPRDHPARAPHARAARWSARGVRYEGRTLLPDVDEACEEVAGAITPRVGGVGPTTIAMLFRNLVEIAERNAGAGVTDAALGPVPAVCAAEGPRRALPVVRDDRRVRPGSPEPLRGCDAVADGRGDRGPVRDHPARGGAHRLSAHPTTRPLTARPLTRG